MKKILIVDDSREIRLLVKATLNNDEYKIYEEENGDNAIEAARKYRPDLVIMDLIMPGKIDGMEAIRRLKSHPDTRKCPIIILSGSAKIKRDEGIKAGAEEFFLKPFSPLDLISKVDLLLGAIS